MFTEAQNFSLVQTELDEVFRQNYEATLPPSYATAMTAEIFKVTDTTHAAYIGTIHKGPGLFSKIGEVQAVPTYTAKVANKWTVTIADFSEGIEVSKDLFDDDMHGEWQSQIAELAIMARRTQDYNAFKIFRGAFTTTLSADGSALIGSHTLIGGGTTNNEIVSADVGAATSVLTTSSYNIANKRLAEVKSQSGIPLQCVGDVLLVPPSLYVAARQIAVSALVPENANNGVNVFSMDYAVKVYQSVWLGTASPDGLGSDTAWFVMDSKRHAVRRFVRQGIITNLRDWGMSNNRTYFYQANFREEVYAPDYIGLVGAKGTSA
ncbi:MAG: Mu-like prophage major head subunit gpT family protein [Candidatus Paceibacterota bacterium]